MSQPDTVEVHQTTDSKSLIVDAPLPDTMPQFAVHFTFEDKHWVTYIYAADFDEAERKVEALKETAWLDGKMLDAGSICNE